ncbi:MAG: hypothetical protein ACRDID_06790, partial [Ktedonobacterales bacterium]
MLTGVPTAPRMPVAPSPRRRVWPWAAGSILITLAVIAATLVGHRLAAQHRLASEVAPAPALPPLAVQAIARAPGQITHMTLDARTHTLVAQIIECLSKPPTSPQTPQAVACDSADVVPVSGVAFFDGATGATRAQYLSPSSKPAQAIALTDTAHGVTYLLTNGGVSVFSDATGKQTNQYDSQLVATAQATALDDQTGLIYTVNGDSALNALTAADGQYTASASLPPPSASGTTDPQVRIDASAGRVYVYNGNAMNPVLYAFNASDLAPLGSWRLPGRGGWLGPLDSAAHTLYLGVSQINLSALPADGAGEQVNAEQTVQDAILGKASRFGFDSASGAAVVMNSVGVEAFAINATQPYAALPLVHAPTVLSADANPWLLPVDSAAGLAYLPGDDNTILIVSLAQPASRAAPNALTAEVIARAGMAALLPDTNQNPPFLAAQTFP